VPVWHERTQAWREAGRLQLVGLVPEQHRDRTRLWAQWHRIDWPILWDPFSVSTSRVVPTFVAVDEHGIVRAVNPQLDTFEEEFLDVDFPAPAEAPVVPRPGTAHLVEVEQGYPGTYTHDHARALSALLWGEPPLWDREIEVLDAHAKERTDDWQALFHAGVAHRLRYDARGDVADFRRAVEYWRAALAVDPNMYIVRRRLQQYGPRMDKPYPFYAWVDEARAAIRERGEVPIELVASLTPAELALPRRKDAAEAAAKAPTSPDPEGRIERDALGLVELETVVTWDTSGERRTACLNVVLRPNATRDVHWTNHVEAPRLWIGPAEEPTGWSARQRLATAAEPEAPTSTERRTLSLDLDLPAEGAATSVKGYVLYAVCEGETGQCLFLRQDFEAPLR
jgi:hypothetical protein